MERLEPLLALIAQHPGWAVGFVAFASFFDTLLLIGFLMPSYLLLLGIGALISIEALPLWPTLFAATAGAAAGDALNYWLGRRYLERWVAHPRMTRLADSVAHTRAFFRRRGALALIVARIVGPTRPLGPMIAGAAHMPLLRFAAILAVSCPLWTAVYVLPGVAIGASLQLAAEVGTRLVLLLVGAIVLALGLYWLASVLARLGGFYAERWLQGLLAWSAHHRRLGWLPRWLADPRYPETPALLIVAVLLLALAWLGLLAGWGLARDVPPGVDLLTYRQLTALHTPWGLEIARWVAHLGDTPVMLVCAAAAIITLAALGRGRAAAHALAALGFGGIIALSLTQGLRIGAPVDGYAGAAARGYRGADLILTCVVYGLLPLLLARPHEADRNLLYYRLAVTLPGLIAAAQLYLGQQWLSIAAGALAVGALWMLTLGIGYRRHRIQPVPARRFLPPMLLSFAAAVVVLEPAPLPTPATDTPRPMTAEQWWAEGWRQLPLARREGGGEPLVLQWRAELGARDAALLADRRGALRTLAASTPAAELPVPPQPLGLQPPQAMFQRAARDGDARIVLRLWRAPATVDATPLWLGSLSRLGERRVLGLLRLPYTEAVALPPDPWLAELEDTRRRQITAARIPRDSGGPDPGLLLLQTPDPSRP